MSSGCRLLADATATTPLRAAFERALREQLSAPSTSLTISAIRLDSRAPTATLQLLTSPPASTPRPEQPSLLPLAPLGTMVPIARRPPQTPAPGQYPPRRARARARAEQEDWTYRRFPRAARDRRDRAAPADASRALVATRRGFPFSKRSTTSTLPINRPCGSRSSAPRSRSTSSPRASALIFIGKPGRGKTHLAIAIAYRAIQNGFDALLRHGRRADRRSLRRLSRGSPRRRPRDVHASRRCSSSTRSGISRTAPTRPTCSFTSSMIAIAEAVDDLHHQQTAATSGDACSTMTTSRTPLSIASSFSPSYCRGSRSA